MAQLPVLTSLPAAIHSVNRAYPQVSSYLPAALGRSVSCFSRQLPVLYQDNSIQKETRLKRQSKAKASLLRRQTCIAQSRTAQIQRQKAHLQTQKAHRSHLQSLHREIHSQRQQADQAATTIQRWVRGWLCRLRQEGAVIEWKRRDVQGKVGEMTGFANRFYMTTGNGPAEAAVVLQRAFRRYRKVKMIRVIERGYRLYRDYQEHQLTPILTRFLRMRLATAELKRLKFETFRTRRLEEIRLTLTRLRLERWWRRLGLSFKAVQDKVKRFRRRKYAHRARAAKQTIAAAQVIAKVIEEGTADRTQETEEDGAEDRQRRYSLCASETSSEKARAAEEALEQQRKFELQQKLKACGVHKAREMPLFPLLAEKPVQEAPYSLKQNVFSRIMMPTEAMKYRCTTAYLPPKDLFVHRRTATTTPQTAITKLSSPPASSRGLEERPRKREEHRYSQPTASFLQAVEARNAYLPLETLVLPRKGWTPKGNLLTKTYASICKEREKKGVATPTHPWIPMISVYEAEYVPGLDNAAVLPRQFKAKPLNRRILESPRWLRMTIGEGESRGVEALGDYRLNSSI